MFTFSIEVKGFEDIAIVSAETRAKARYKQWLKSANETNYWKSFIDFCKDCKVKKVEEVL